MTTFDEEMMQRALKEAADDFTVSEGAVERILDEARASAAADELPRIRAFVQRNGRVRSSMMAAAACVVLLAVAVPLFNVESPAPKFNAINKVHGEALPAGEKVLSPNPGLTVQGTGDVSGDVAPLSETATSAKTTQHGLYESSGSSLRVEEVGTIHLSVAGRHFQSTLTQLTDFATTDGGFVASTQSHIGTKASHSYSTGSIVLDVPEHDFTMLIDQVRHAGDATSVVTSANDVTGQYVDLQARISALQVSRAQDPEDHDEDRLHQRDPLGAEPAQLDPEPDRTTPGAARSAQLRDDVRDADRRVAPSRQSNRGRPAPRQRHRQGVARLAARLRGGRGVADPDRRTAPVRTLVARGAVVPRPMDLAGDGTAA